MKTIIFLALAIVVILAQQKGGDDDYSQFGKELQGEMKNALQAKLKAQLLARLQKTMNRWEELENVVEESQQQKKKGGFFGKLRDEFKGIGKELGDSAKEKLKAKLMEKASGALGNVNLEEVEESQQQPQKKKNFWNSLRDEFKGTGKELADSAKEKLKAKLMEKASGALGNVNLEEVEESQQKKKGGFFGKIRDEFKGIGKELGDSAKEKLKAKLMEKASGALGNVNLEEVEESQQQPQKKKNFWNSLRDEFKGTGKELADSAKEKLKAKLMEKASGALGNLNMEEVEESGSEKPQFWAKAREVLKNVGKKLLDGAKNKIKSKLQEKAAEVIERIEGQAESRRQEIAKSFNQ